ncbi:MAG: sigma-70 family RNA polymerase sigma factor, partial [Planctomycetes bacterium]|nr:sigma-70 family RNA polymerase sigma factor [Planctomycetota bacterium]
STTTGSRLEPAGAEPTPSANVRSEEQDQLVRAALDRIPDTTDRQIVQLRFFDGLSLRQIAERLKLGYDQVRERYHRGMQRLERELGGLR